MDVRAAGVLRLGRRRFEPGQLLVMATVVASLDEARSAVAEEADIVEVFRVRGLRETRRALRMVSAIRGDVPPACAVRGLA